MANEYGDLRQTLFQKLEQLLIYLSSVGGHRAEGWQCPSWSMQWLSQNGDIMPRLGWLNSRSMAWANSGEFLYRRAAFLAPIDRY